MNILITGGSGFIGSVLVADLYAKQNNITVLTRDKTRVHNQHVGTVNDLQEIADDVQFDAIINLAGETISKRWTESYKRRLLDSRIQVTQSLNHLLARLQHKPPLILSASAVGYYGDQGQQTVTETSQPNLGFTHSLCHAWEQEAQKAQQWGCEVVIMRLGVVLGTSSGVGQTQEGEAKRKGKKQSKAQYQGILKETLPMFRLGLGGKLGAGNQFLSWVHIADVVAAMQFLMHQRLILKIPLSSVYNITAPNPVSNLYWTQFLASAVSRPAKLALPRVVVKLMFGEMGEALLLQGQKVLPEHLQKEGFEFAYPKLPDALGNIIDHG